MTQNQIKQRLNVSQPTIYRRLTKAKIHLLRALAQ
ncbi:hypothetical protein [Scytonema sp. NUACC26]